MTKKRPPRRCLKCGQLALLHQGTRQMANVDRRGQEASVTTYQHYTCTNCGERVEFQGISTLWTTISTIALVAALIKVLLNPSGSEPPPGTGWIAAAAVLVALVWAWNLFHLSKYWRYPTS